jgi:hypothetical protein
MGLTVSACGKVSDVDDGDDDMLYDTTRHDTTQKKLP